MYLKEINDKTMYEPRCIGPLVLSKQNNNKKYRKMPQLRLNAVRGFFFFFFLMGFTGFH